MTSSLRALALVALLALGGCGGGSAEPGPSATPSASVPADQQGTPAPQALSDLSCAATDQGTWTATGALANDADQPVTYRVTAYVGPADGVPRRGVGTTVESVEADESARFEITGIPPHGEAPTCHVQVLVPD